MNRKKCPCCQSSLTKRNGKRNGVQLYKCYACGRQFRASEKMTDEQLWYLYQERKQTIAELAQTFGVSVSTIKRRLHVIHIEWTQPDLHGMSGYVHLDTTYWGRSWGVLVALDDVTKRALYIAYVSGETNEAYALAVYTIQEKGYEIRGLILDGRKGLFLLFKDYKIQMCQFHMKQIIIRYLTKNPRIKASMALLLLINDMPKVSKEKFEIAFQEWKERYAETIKKKSISKVNEKMHYTHKRLRGAMRSIEFYLPYLFTYKQPECICMPNTNNKIEGIFTDLKKNLNMHSGLSEDNRKRIINGFFLALEGNLHINKTEGKNPL